MDEVASPCIQVCRLDDVTGWCIGCSRTLAEIAAWCELSEPVKARIVASLPRRTAMHAERHTLSEPKR